MCGATERAEQEHYPLYISIHAPRVGCDEKHRNRVSRHRNFNPRTPCGVRRDRGAAHGHHGDFNPRTPCGVRRRASSPTAATSNFNPRTPCGVRLAYLESDSGEMIFQSTHPVWGATSCGASATTSATFQSTHPVWGATCRAFAPVLHGSHFNPRTPCGVRLLAQSSLSSGQGFQSTHPVWGATQIVQLHHKGIHISIHAPRVGCDVKYRVVFSPSGHFNPRTPCGVRRQVPGSIFAQWAFQSTHPVWGATPYVAKFHSIITISIHAPRVGCDDIWMEGRQPR